MTKVIENQDTGEYDLVDVHTGEVIDSVDDQLAAYALKRIYNEEG